MPASSQHPSNETKYLMPMLPLKPQHRPVPPEILLPHPGIAQIRPHRHPPMHLVPETSRPDAARSASRQTPAPSPGPFPATRAAHAARRSSSRPRGQSSPGGWPRQQRRGFGMCWTSPVRGLFRPRRTVSLSKGPLLGWKDWG
ncbi:hypothetical protein BO99DRAFT_46545 [Aspergillus violaceofuscus CBS 115571]|uniref:Uncharacterized protein n=1 Tax=Aspergillus violaceofuscus (strain CBS 115571) TaxID=1450538 RepID=A0A2V5GX76_ASPV1|nr:hypothetical protein BO99DRAFT_46545 [Aspergillus violaceofuscus CBS 115571]